MNSNESTAPDSSTLPPSENDAQDTPAEMPDMVSAEQVNNNDLPPQSDDDILPVIGLGGSAGSIRALQRFFDFVQPDLGVAYVVVIHLSPDHESSLAEIIGARTSMKVVQVTEPVQIAPNCVYVVPPTHHLTMQDSKLYLSEPQQERGQRVAVDLLFRSIAATHRSRSVAIVLSGNDGDGSIGVKRIKEHGGVTIAQDPDEADYNGMPRSAIETGMVDWILPVRQIAEKVAEWIGNEREIRLPTPEQVAVVDTEEADVVALREILSFLHARTGHDFTHYKRATVLRRIGRRLQVNSLTTLPQYADYMRTHPGEAGALLQDLLISVTNFFRDPESFHVLEAYCSSLFQGKRSGDMVRVWVAGCATGEEAYSVAMLLLEYADKLQTPPQIQIFATDLDEAALQAARDGLYPQSIVADVSPERLRRFFILEQGRYRVKKEVRELILFAPHNLLQDAPFSRLDLVTCRNLLIYFNAEAQSRVLDVFHFALRPGGILFLGTSENAENNKLFHAQDRKHSLYVKEWAPITHLPTPSIMLPRPVPMREIPRLRQGLGLPAALRGETAPAQSAPALSATTLHEQLLVQVARPSVLVNSDYEMLRLANNANRYVQYTGGEVSNNVLLAVPSALRLSLRTALFKALQSGQDVDVAPVLVELEGQPRLLGAKVHPQFNSGNESESSSAAVVVFQESPVESDQTLILAPTASDETVQRLEDELQHMRNYLRATVEEHEVATEELKAFNEELQALNEEQRSAAEELESSREEIHATNEELTTVNAELKLKIEEVGRSNSDLQNLMASTSVATVFLTRELFINRYTPPAVELFNFIPTDTGRPLADLKHDFTESAFIDDARRVLRTLTPVERELRTYDDRWFLCRIAPYRTLDDKIDGVVLTFVDITQNKQAVEELRSFVSVSMDVLYRMSPDWSEMRSLEGRNFLADTRNPTQSWLGGYIPEDAQERVQKAIQQAIDSKSIFELEHRVIRSDGAVGWTFSRAVPLLDPNGEIREWLGAAADITDRKEAEEEIKRGRDELEARVAQRTRELEAALAQARSDAQELQRMENDRMELLKRIVTTQEDERGRIARELHDNLGQHLTAIMLALQSLDDQVGQLPSIEDMPQLQRLRAQVDGLMRAAHVQATELRPPELDQIGLEAALGQYIRDWSERTDVTVDFQTLGWQDRRLYALVETTLYRVVQEALTNIGRHADAAIVGVVLELNNRFASVIIEDDGVGFDTDAVTKRLGIVGMRERMSIIGGTLDIESSPGDGTTVFARVPVPA